VNGAATPDHLVAVPVLLPLATAALMLLLGEGRRRVKAMLGAVSALLGLGVAVALLLRVDTQGATAFAVCLPGNWPVPYGIVLVADRLSALMAVLAGGVGLAALLFALARWQHAGVYFHVLFQLQLMGLYGAFLTADLFNLFIFSVGSLSVDREPIVRPGVTADLAQYTDPLPQSLVLTAIVIGFATTALFLVVLLALRGLSGGDHVDGREERP